jgi:hypothetical protein
MRCVHVDEVERALPAVGEQRDHRFPGIFLVLVEGDRMGRGGDRLAKVVVEPFLDLRLGVKKIDAMDLERVTRGQFSDHEAGRSTLERAELEIGAGLELVQQPAPLRRLFRDPVVDEPVFRHQLGSLPARQWLNWNAPT